MTDFSLRNAILQYPGRREEQRYDLVFRGGRLCALHPVATSGPPRLYVTPGFWDAHIHLLHVGLARRRANLGGSESLSAALAALGEFARRHPAREVIWGVGWDENTWSERRLPTREEIDAQVADRPAIMRRVCGHVAVLNSPALERARQRWPDLSPSGRVAEEQAMGLAEFWPESPEERERALRDAQELAVACGITRVSEMGSRGAAAAYLALRQRGELHLHAVLYFSPEEIERAIELRAGGTFDDSRFRLGGIKIFADGSVGARTAAFLEPYADRQERGTLLYPDHALYALLARCRQADLPVAVHAIGDAALGQVLRQLERLAAEHGRLAAGWASLEHAELLPPEALERCARLGLRMSVQPNFVARWGQPGGLYDRALGHERWKRMNPFREIWQHGLALVFGSDGMPMDPAVGLQGAVEHPVAESRLSAEEALGLYLGARAFTPGLRDPEEWWVIGCRGAVLYEEDPLLLAGGDLARAPLGGVFWEGAWRRPPTEALRRSGGVHVD